MSVVTRRAYDSPSAGDGYRVLVDRVWPRGRTRASLELDEWAPELGPSTELRRWFGHDPARWQEFHDRFADELRDASRAAKLDELAERARHGPMTIVYGARDEKHNQARVIAEELERRLRTLKSSARDRD
jgi:uncharacterized protein YeaO (DUF488 family)